VPLPTLAWEDCRLPHLDTIVILIRVSGILYISSMLRLFETALRLLFHLNVSRELNMRECDGIRSWASDSLFRIFSELVFCRLLGTIREYHRLFSSRGKIRPEGVSESRQGAPRERIQD
jgi:hypothetical protein